MIGADAQDPQIRKAQIDNVINAIAESWNTHDMKRFAACFADDADFVNVGGMWWRGREEIEQKHAAVHAGRFKESSMQMQLAAFREIAPGVAVTHITWQLDGHGESGPTRTTETRRGVMSWTVRDRDGKVEIISSHNTDVFSPPSG